MKHQIACFFLGLLAMLLGLGVLAGTCWLLGNGFMRWRRGYWPFSDDQIENSLAACGFLGALSVLGIFAFAIGEALCK